MKKITKTPEQAAAERSIEYSDAKCPYCGLVAIFNLVYTKNDGWFKTKKVGKYSCVDCGCEWEVER